MLHTIMTAAAWLLGIGGVAGLVAAVATLIYLGPAVAAAIVQPIFARFVACTKCVVLVVVVLTAIAAYWLGHHQAANECRDAELSAALRTKQFDADIANETAKEAQEASAESAARAATFEQKVKEYADALKSRPNDACLLTDDDFPDGVRKRARANHPNASSGK